MSAQLCTLQWNATRSLVAIQSLLPLLSLALSPPHLLLIQELPWYPIGLQPSLTDPAGLTIYGVPSISGYVAVLPPNTCPRVVTYVSCNLPQSSWSVIGPTTSSTDVLMVGVHAQITVRVCNYYGMNPPECDAPSPQYPGESFLFSLPSVLATSLLVCGDFNHHHHPWSDLTATRRELLGAQPLDDFFWENGLEPAHAPDSDSCLKDGLRWCPIDMVWAPPHIMPESILNSFTSARSQLSNHAQLTWVVTTNLPPPLPQVRCLTNDDYGEWTELAFPALVEAFKLLTTTTTLLDAKATSVVNAMKAALQPFTTLARPSKTKVPWWTPSCGDLLKAIDAAPTN
ncbi:hypothetical protein M0805_004501 [Coniferiporia weirii]|nr:hypothetical protein M0805_004501 [Coniferiporia weirii]